MLARDTDLPGITPWQGGHGHFDMQADMDYFAGKLEDRDYHPASLAMALSGLPSVREAA